MAKPVPLQAVAVPVRLQVGTWALLPFVGLLLAIALLPLIAAKFWHQNRNRALVVALFAGPMALYLIGLELMQGEPGLHALLEGLEDYAAFMILLGALYTVAGGVLVHVHTRPTPLVNAALLAGGAVLANLIGTTGASMLLIRPFLRMNHSRQHTRHLPIFFIFLVSNLGGALTPLGDPPLFLGLLRGVDFFWTLSLWPQWAVANGVVLALFLAWDTLVFRREPPLPAPHRAAGVPLINVSGLVNLGFLAGILAAVLLQSEQAARTVQDWLRQWFACPDLHLRQPWPPLAMALMALLSLAVTPRGLRQTNAFSWAALIEVAILFLGIFVTMVPALELLRGLGQSEEFQTAVREPWHYFWLTGGLSAVLDNAPTYLAFATLAAGEHDIAWLMEERPMLLAAVSCGAVFMGAVTYLGNGPNFMVKAIAEEAGYATPSFFGYVVYAAAILLPTFVLVMVLFFPPW